MSKEEAEKKVDDKIESGLKERMKRGRIERIG